MAINDRSKRAIAVASTAAGLTLGATVLAGAATGADEPATTRADDDTASEIADSDTPLTDPSLDRAVAAALDASGGGTVTDTEIGDDGAAFSVEIRLDDGSQVEINLDESYDVIGQAPDGDAAGSNGD